MWSVFPVWDYFNNADCWIKQSYCIGATADHEPPPPPPSGKDRTTPGSKNLLTPHQQVNSMVTTRLVAAKEMNSKCQSNVGDFFERCMHIQNYKNAGLWANEAKAAEEAVTVATHSTWLLFFFTSISSPVSNGPTSGKFFPRAERREIPCLSHSFRTPYPSSRHRHFVPWAFAVRHLHPLLQLPHKRNGEILL